MSQQHRLTGYFRDIKNSYKIFSIALLRIKEVIMWLFLLPIGLTLVGALTQKDPRSAFHFLVIASVLAIIMSSVQFLTMVIGTARFGGTYIQFKISGYKSSVLLLSQSLVMITFSTLTSVVAIIIFIAIKGTAGFEGVGGISPWINIISFFGMTVFGSIMFTPYAWVLSSLGKDLRATQLYASVGMMLLCGLGGVYYPLYAIKTDVLRNILYLLPSGSVTNLIGWASNISGTNLNPWVLTGEAIELIAIFTLLLTTSKYYFKWE